MKDTTKENVKTISGYLGGMAASAYATFALTTICPPVGIITGLGSGLIAGGIGDKIRPYTEELVGAVFDVVDYVKDSIKKEN